jgi:hypothetical protein
MAKKQPSLNIFAKTEQAEVKQDDPVKPVGIGLKESEWVRFEEIARAMNTTKHALAVWALRDFLRRYDTGEIRTEQRPTLPGL